jgi:hypothetical protein
MTDINAWHLREGQRLMRLQREADQATPDNREQATAGGQGPADREPLRYVQATDPMPTSAEAYADVRAVIGQTGPLSEAREITDATARTIAGWWASPGKVGPVLASLSTGQPVELGALLYDISVTRETHADMSAIDGRALDCLATWALRSAREG